MADHVDILHQEILTKIQEIGAAEGQRLQLEIELGRLMVKMRAKVRKKRWQKEIKEFGFDPRVANRYLMIGENWATPDRTPESELLAKLPTDLLKLEWLCRVPLDGLVEMTRSFNLRKANRGTVIEAVKHRLGIKDEEKDKEVSVDHVRKLFKSSFENMVDVVKELDGKPLTEKDRAALQKELEEEFARLESALNNSNEEDAQPEGGQDAGAAAAQEEPVEAEDVAEEEAAKAEDAREGTEEPAEEPEPVKAKEPAEKASAGKARKPKVPA